MAHYWRLLATTGDKNSKNKNTTKTGTILKFERSWNFTFLVFTFSSQNFSVDPRGKKLSLISFEKQQVLNMLTFKLNGLMPQFIRSTPRREIECTNKHVSPVYERITLSIEVLGKLSDHRLF